MMRRDICSIKVKIFNSYNAFLVAAKELQRKNNKIILRKDRVVLLVFAFYFIPFILLFAGCLKTLQCKNTHTR